MDGWLEVYRCDGYNSVITKTLHVTKSGVVVLTISYSGIYTDGTEYQFDQLFEDGLFVGNIVTEVDDQHSFMHYELWEEE